ncbi:hypothetical protein [Ensifer sp. MJa1]|uniref:hypothetical protein n=1 Tax=Ensifer sp. MJa1 TaxID=2919888 RepID=UPI00300B0537
MGTDGDGNMLQHRTWIIARITEERKQSGGKIVHDVIDLASTAAKTGGSRSLGKLRNFPKQRSRQMEGERIEIADKPDARALHQIDKAYRPLAIVLDCGIAAVGLDIAVHDVVEVEHQEISIVRWQRHHAAELAAEPALQTRHRKPGVANGARDEDGSTRLAKTGSNTTWLCHCLSTLASQAMEFVARVEPMHGDRAGADAHLGAVVHCPANMRRAGVIFLYALLKFSRKHFWSG